MPYTPYQPTWNNPYLPQLPTYQAPQVQPYQQPVNGTTQVSGPESAMQYGRRMPPNSTSPALFNTNGKVFYIVTTDGAGMPTLETFDFSPHVEEQPIQIDGAQFVSRQEFESFTAKVNAALGALNGIHEPVPTAGTADADEGQNGPAPLDAARGHVGSGQQPRSV